MIMWLSVVVHMHTTHKNNVHTYVKYTYVSICFRIYVLCCTYTYISETKFLNLAIRNKICDLNSSDQY